MNALELKTRILSFLERESETARRELSELRALSIEDRVLAGDCIRGLSFETIDRDGKLRFSCDENVSKFREGDPVLLSDGKKFEAGAELNFARHDPLRLQVFLSRDRFSRDAERFVPKDGVPYCADRRNLTLADRLVQSVETSFTKPDEGAAAALRGLLAPLSSPERRAAALRAAQKLALDESQREAFADAIATETFCLIQGPPGTGKTRLLAEIIACLVRSSGCRIALTAFTHRAVNNALTAIHAAQRQRGFPTYKIGDRRNSNEVLDFAEVATDARRFVFPKEGGFVLAGTSFALAKLPADLRFHFTFFDEAGQIPLAHAFPGMNVARRWVFLGDHQQLPPVIQGDHADELVTRSVFEHMSSMHGSRMLTRSYRMNDAICSFVGDAFYGGNLTPAPAAAARRLRARPGGRFEDLLDPRKPLVVGVVEHEGRLMRSPEEADVAAALVNELVHHHGHLQRDIAVVSPFRAQNALIDSLLRNQARLVQADTVDRIQGQEFEVVIVSLTSSDPDYLRKRAEFLFSTNRLNVAISRARTKCIVLGSRAVFRGKSLDVEHLKAMSLFSRIYRQWPRVELTPALSSPIPDV